MAHCLESWIEQENFAIDDVFFECMVQSSGRLRTAISLVSRLLGTVCSAGGKSMLMSSKGSPEVQGGFAIPKGKQRRKGEKERPYSRESRKRARVTVTGVTRDLRRWHACEKGKRVGLPIA